MLEAGPQLPKFSFAELQQVAGLKRLDCCFLDYLRVKDESLHHQLLEYRHQGQGWSETDISTFILQCAPFVEQFIGELYDIEAEMTQLQTAVLADDPIFAFKKYYVLREAKRCLKRISELPPFGELNRWLQDSLAAQPESNQDQELAVATLAVQWLAEPAAHQADIERLVHWCAHVLAGDPDTAAIQQWVSFRLPAALDYEHLVPVEAAEHDGEPCWQAPADTWRQRDGFELTDARMTRREVLAEVNYCVYCHKNNGDFCSKGFPVKKSDPSLGLKTNPLGEVLTGCPLEEKISEMHVLKKAGLNVAALATIMIDNPMCPITGHRICNDCMKACIYQKQEPVNIPQIETRVLTDVLALSWGVEIYDLLTRWNPLRSEQWVAEAYNGKKVMVMGMGPAGFTLAHHLLMAGCAVVGCDGLKIEPLPEALLTQPIKHYQSLVEDLSDRLMYGFGGVAEYGITVRWDKNFLKLIYISLCRRPYFQLCGNVRFGGTLTVENVWSLGFDHLAIAVGAGLPRELPVPGSLAPGMRQANDFLMALQLTGAAKSSSLANLQVHLPAVVIGGGLTGIDTATEVQAYYIKQVEKVLWRYESLVNFSSEALVRQQFDAVALRQLDEFIAHGKLVRQERAKAQREDRQPDFIQLLRQWGGVTIVYRRCMQESPAYQRNHEEVTKALQEGIYYAEALEPQAVVVDADGYVSALRCVLRVCDDQGQWHASNEIKTLPARAIFVATGAKPNVAYEFEHRGTFEKIHGNYARFDLEDNQLSSVAALGHCKSQDFGPFTSYQHEHYRVTFLGDTHPVFHGSVVKAVASAKRTYPKILQATNNALAANVVTDDYAQFRECVTDEFNATLLKIERHGAHIVELTIRAPLAAKNFQPGQFYRLQNYAVNAPIVVGTQLQTEAMALLGARLYDDDRLTFLVLERGVSSRLVSTFVPGQSVALMGPTGVRSKLPEMPEQVMIIGGSMAVAYLRSYAPALRKQGSQVFYVALMRDMPDHYWRDELENLCDVILWVRETDVDETIVTREQDMVASGELTDILVQYAQGNIVSQLGQSKPALSAVDRVVVIGSAHLLRRFQQARQTILKNAFQQTTRFLASVYGPMQCMLKGVCAQCLQWQIDPATGKRTKAVYACSWQEQPMELIDIANIDQRLQQNHCQETLVNLWLDYLLQTQAIERI